MDTGSTSDSDDGQLPPSEDSSAESETNSDGEPTGIGLLEAKTIKEQRLKHSTKDSQGSQQRVTKVFNSKT